jgi:hypothetical protein
MVHAALRRRRVFLALDDVRSADDVRPFLVGGAGSVLVVGTRWAEVLDDLGVPATRRIVVGSMTAEEGLALCEQVAGPLKERERRLAREMGERVEWIPLAVESLAAQGAEIGWAAILRTLRAAQNNPALAGESRWDRAIRSAQESVWDVLTAEEREWVLDLACLPQAASFDERALQSVARLSAEAARERLRFLTRRYVLKRAEGAEERYRMHWLWYRFAQQKARAAGRKVEDTAWVERYAGVLVQPRRWWWPSYRARRPWRFGHWLRRWYLRPVPPQRRGVVEGIRSLKEPYYKAIGEAWAMAGLEPDALPMEVYGTHLLLRRRSNRYGRWVVGSGLVWIGLVELTGRLPASLGRGLLVLLGKAAMVSGVAFALAVWVFAVHLVNLYRFMDRWVDGEGA